MSGILLNIEYILLQITCDFCKRKGTKLAEKLLSKKGNREIPQKWQVLLQQKLITVIVIQLWYVKLHLKRIEDAQGVNTRGCTRVC